MTREETADTKETLDNIQWFGETDDGHVKKLKKTDRKLNLGLAEPTTMKNTHIPTHTYFLRTNLRAHHGANP